MRNEFSYFDGFQFKILYKKNEIHDHGMKEYWLYKMDISIASDL
jgi:hypothetical protein